MTIPVPRFLEEFSFVVKLRQSLEGKILMSKFLAEFSGRPVDGTEFFKLLVNLDLVRLCSEDIDIHVIDNTTCSNYNIFVRSVKGKSKWLESHAMRPDPRSALLDGLIDNMSMMKGSFRLSFPKEGLKSKVCYICCQFILFGDQGPQAEKCINCWRVYHPSCAVFCVCFSKAAKRHVEVDIPEVLEKVMGFHGWITSDDKYFLAKLFPKLNIQFATASTPKNYDECVGTSEIDNMFTKEDYADFEDNFKKTLTKVFDDDRKPRCTICSLPADCQAGCCEFHVYCDQCRKTTPVLNIRCEKSADQREIFKNRAKVAKVFSVARDTIETIGKLKYEQLMKSGPVTYKTTGRSEFKLVQRNPVIVTEAVMEAEERPI